MRMIPSFLQYVGVISRTLPKRCINSAVLGELRQHTLHRYIFQQLKNRFSMSQVLEKEKELQYIIPTGRRAATRAGTTDTITRKTGNPMQAATTGDLSDALGVRAMGESAARVVIARMMINRKRRLLRHKEEKGHALQPKRAKADDRNDRPAARRVGFSSIKSKGGRVFGGTNKWMGTESGGDEGNVVFQTVLSSMAKHSMREGLKEISSNPHDLLRVGFLEIQPAKHGSTALGCHLINGWAEQIAGNQRRVSQLHPGHEGVGACMR